LREGETLRALAAEIGTTRDIVGEWLAGKSIGQKESKFFAMFLISG
jgi:hypothetical protein